jgi:hypothetical protein
MSGGDFFEMLQILGVVPWQLVVIANNSIGCHRSDHIDYHVL